MCANILYEDFPTICRLCLGRGNLQHILKIKELEFFRPVLNIKLEEEKLPQNVCLKCVKQLDDIFNFVENCNKNENILTEILEQVSNVEQDEIANNSFDTDIKNEDSTDNDFFLKDVKQEFVELEPDIVLQIKKDGPLICENCSESFSSLTGLSEHYKIFANCRPKDLLSSKNDICNIVDYLKKPKQRRGKKKIKEESDGEPEYVKGKKLKGKRRFLCNFCGKNYTRKNGLERHILSHSGIKPFECKECGKSYITKDTLKTHLLTHTGIKAHKCTVCQKSFTQSSHLSYHMRRHAGEKPHRCTYCGKAFLSSYHLERHKLMHTGVKPYECNLCGKQFVRSTTLRDHLLIHSGEKPFQCQHCGKQFNRKQSLTNHVLVHTGGKNSNSSSNVPIGLNVVSSDNSFKYVNSSNELSVNQLLSGDIPGFLPTSAGIKSTGVDMFVNSSIDAKTQSDGLNSAS
ncbi:zinc finger and SCAN domain-containing protein 31-like [Diorhabda carinulata]|uniref:zinc finger and SCAN domain-containing protein 31-like n=1 Tax=Diorhabda carinulata TaxID=1163345 RepID=UPI0025A194B5|nr:zinc finger and SCAN domain-containing protein 31-like [Diorhabda carinulata]